MRIHELVFSFFLLTLAGADVIQLTQDKFDATLATYPVVMVNFYADWCHFCRALEPIYDQVGKTFNKETLDKKIAITRVDSVAEVALGQKFNVNKYPTLKVFIYGHERKPEYRGERSVEALTSFLNSLNEHQYTVIPYAETGIKDIHTAGDEVSFIAIIKKNNQKSLEIFDKVSKICGGSSKFYIAFGPENVEEKIYYKEDDVLKGEISMKGSSDDLVKWVLGLASPFVRELTFLNAEEITEEGKPLLVFFYSSKDMESRKKFREVVKSKLSHVDSVTFLTGDGEIFLHPLTHLGKGLEDLPLIVLDSFQHMYIYKKPIQEIFSNPSGLEEFVKDLHSGKLHREYHYGPDKTETTKPAESVFKNLAPNENRYSIKDEF